MTKRNLMKARKQEIKDATARRHFDKGIAATVTYTHWNTMQPQPPQAFHTLKAAERIAAALRDNQMKDVCINAN